MCVLHVLEVFRIRLILTLANYVPIIALLIVKYVSQDIILIKKSAVDVLQAVAYVKMNLHV